MYTLKDVLDDIQEVSGYEMREMNEVVGNCVRI